MHALPNTDHLGLRLIQNFTLTLRIANALGTHGAHFYTDRTRKVLRGDLYYNEGQRRLLLASSPDSRKQGPSLVLTTVESASRVYPRPGFVYLKDLPHGIHADNGATAQLPGLIDSLAQVDVINAGLLSHMTNSDTVTLVEINQRILRKINAATH